MTDKRQRAARSGEAACSVESTTHEVIEAKLLHALANTDKVALVVTRENLDTIIHALKSVPIDGEGRSMLAGLRQLRSAAFPPNPSFQGTPHETTNEDRR